MIPVAEDGHPQTNRRSSTKNVLPADVSYWRRILLMKTVAKDDCGLRVSVGRASKTTDWQVHVDAGLSTVDMVVLGATKET